MTSIFRTFIAVCLAALLVLPVMGQESGYRFGFDNEPQVIKQTTAQQNPERRQKNLETQQKLHDQIQDAKRRQENLETQQKLREQIRNLGGQPVAQTTEKQKQFGQFYARPLEDGKATTLAKVQEYLTNPRYGLNQTRIALWHEHFYSRSTGYDVGYGPQGIYNGENPLEENGTPLGNIQYEVDIMKSAEQRLRESGQWLPNPDGKFFRNNPYLYHVVIHNCQDFAEELRKVYYILKVVKQYKFFEKKSLIRLITNEQSKSARPGTNQLYHEDTQTGEDYILDRHRVLGFRVEDHIPEYNKLLKNIEKDLSRCPDDFQEKFRKYSSDQMAYCQHILTVSKAHRDVQVGPGWETVAGAFPEVSEDIGNRRHNIFLFYENELRPVLKKYGCSKCDLYF
jgi:hypothetical protein